MAPGEKQIAAQETLLVSVLKKFPEAEEKLRHLFRVSPSFQSLCEDYRDCLAALRHWRQATSESAPAMCQSYAELLQELEQEVRQFLEDERVSRANR